MSKSFEFVVSAADAGLRLDQFLAKQTDLQLSRSRLQKLITQGAVTIDQKSAPPRQILRYQSTIKLSLPEVQKPTQSGRDIPLEILYEDDELLAVNKPAHLTVHSGAGANYPTLVDALTFHFKKLSTLAGVERSGIVHRLDKETSGVMVVAKTDQAHAHISRQFAERQTEKIYEAIVWGKMRAVHGSIQGAIARHPNARQKMTSKTTRLNSKARSALTEWRLLKQFGHFAHLRLAPKTGRTHQLRVHLADASHAIVGDGVYGGKQRSHSYPFTAEVHQALSKLNRHLLHARTLTLTHPQSGERLHLEAPLPEAFTAFLSTLERFDLAKK